MKHKLFLLLPFGYLLLLLLQPSIEMTEDLGRQVKMGEIILNCRCIPQINLFSYTYERFPIVNYSWLFSVIVSFFASSFGIESLFYLKIGIFISIFGVLYLALQKKMSTFWFIAFMVLVINIFSNRFLMRPEIFSYLFLSIYLLILEKWKQTNNLKLLLILPFLQILWVNIHIFFFIGPFLYLLFLIEQWIQTKKIPQANLLVVFALVIFANLINPYFLEGAVYPFLIFNNYGAQLDENFSPFSNNPLFLADYAYYIWMFELTILIMIIGICLRIKKLPIFLTLTSLSFMILSFRLVRAFPLFAISSLLPLTILYSESEPALKKLGKNSVQSIKVVVGILLLFLVISQTYTLLINKRINPGFSTNRINGVTFVAKQNIKGPIFNSLGIGGNIIYQLYPQEKVFVDARPEAYPADFVKNYQRHFTDVKFFEKQSKKYGFNTLIIARYENYYWTQFLIDYLVGTDRWKQIYKDLWMSVLIRNTPDNKTIIDKFSVE